MPETQTGGCRLFFSVEGPPDGPALLLSNALGTTLDLWDRQLATLAKTFRVVRYDMRGHGRSTAPPGDYTIDQLGADALHVLDAAGAESAHVCGLSLGGMIAMWLAVQAPSRVGRLVLANTAGRIGTRASWQERINLVRASGIEAIVDTALGRWFTTDFCRRTPDVVAAFKAVISACSPDGYAGCAAALRDADLTDALGHITAPVLVLTGKADPVTPPADGELLCARIPGARRVDLDAAHLSNIEDAEAFTTAVLDFLEITEMREGTGSHRGAETRRLRAPTGHDRY